MKNRIKELRKQNGISQAELGKKLHVSGGTISSWEVDRTEPNMMQVLLMAKIFGCSTEEIFGKEPPEIATRVWPNDEENELLERYRASDEQTKEMVKRILAYKEKL